MNAPGLGVLQYDWDAVARLVAALGPDFDTKISHAAINTDLDTIALAAAVGLGETPEYVKDVSPPIASTAQAVMEALNLAFHGEVEAPAATGDANPTLWTSLVARVTRLFAPG